MAKRQRKEIKGRAKKIKGARAFKNAKFSWCTCADTHTLTHSAQPGLSLFHFFWSTTPLLAIVLLCFEDEML